MAKNEAKIKFTAETGDFNKAIQQANSEMTELRAEMKLNETQMKATGETVEGLENKHEILSKQLKASHDKTEALNQKVQKAVEIFGENSTEASKLRTQLLNAQTAEERLRQAVSQCADELKEFKGESQDTRTASEKLNDTIEEQESELKKLKDAYADAVLEYGKGSREAKDLAREIKELSGELKDNQTALGRAEEAADKLDRSFDNAGDAARNAGDGFTVAKGALADLVSEAVQFGIEKVSEFVGYLKELPEATRELRQDMATLETSFETQGFTAEEATDTWKDLYRVFGEDDRAVEAANLIAKMADNQQDLNDWVTITNGVWGSYQDSLPVEGLAEASMESAKTGKVTGVLADALNWSSEAASMFSKYMGEDVVTAEDAFNVALSKCTTEQERQTLITDTLNSLYGEAADKYKESSGAQLDAKEAAAELALAEAELAEKIEPVTTAWDGMKTQLITAVTPAIEAVCGVMLEALEWLKEHPVALKAIAAAMTVVAIGLGGLALAWGAYTVAQWAANSAMLACPVTWIVIGVIAAIAALVAIVVVVIEYWDEIKEAGLNCWEAIKEAWNAAAEWFDTEVIQPVFGFFSNLWNNVKTSTKNAWNNTKENISSAWNSIKTNVKNSIDNVKTSVSNGWNNIKTKTFNVFDGIKTKCSDVWNGIKDTITNTINGARDKVESAINKIKGFFDFEWSLPPLKLPHVSVSGGEPPYGIAGKGSLPKFSVEWYKTGAIFTKPTLFNTPFGFKGVGEAGAEAVLPINKLEGYIANAVERTQNVVNLEALADAIEDLANRPISLNINGRQFALATAGDSDGVGGLRSTFRSRGLALD